MRRIRAHRRARFLLTTILALSFLVFCETQVESFAPQIKYFAKTQIEEKFDKNIKLSIGELEGGIVRPVSLKDVRIENAQGRILLPFLRITRISSNYRFWDVFFAAPAKRRTYFGVFPVEPRIHVDFTTASGEAAGWIRFRGDIADGRIKGRIVLFGAERIEFTGTVKNGAIRLVMETGAGAIEAGGSFTPEGEIALDIALKHLKVGRFDVACDITVRNKLTRLNGAHPAKDLFEGEFRVKNLILDYRPFSDVTAKYTATESVLDIKSLEVGNLLKICGRVYFKEPYVMDMKMNADNAPLNSLLADLGVRGTPVLTGIMNGSFLLRGPASKVRSESRFEIRGGAICGLDFKRLTASLKGEGPILRIEDSRIERESGYFILAGEIDLAKWGRTSMFEDVRLVSSDTAIIWDGWNVARMKGVREETMQKRMTDDVNLGFKKFYAENILDETAREGDEVELEYKLHSKDSLKLSVGQDNTFFGLEHRDKF